MSIWACSPSLTALLSLALMAASEVNGQLQKCSSCLSNATLPYCCYTSDTGALACCEVGQGCELHPPGHWS